MIVYTRNIECLTKQIHSDTFPQRSFVANATSLPFLQCAGDLPRSVDKMNLRINKTSVIFFAFLLLYSCARSYSGQDFSFPPGSKPHENDWIYLCKIIVSDPFGKRPIVGKQGRPFYLYIYIR